MRLLIILSALFLLTVSADQCGNKNKNDAQAEPVRYKGKLETKAICMNYTLRLVQGSIDTSLVAPEWTDENTGKSYKNAFALGNPCNFPVNINQGDEFYFFIDTSSKQDPCIVCMAYYPTPPKKLFIKVVEK
jgi:hypothetical protein